MSDWRFGLVPGPGPGGKATGLVDWGDRMLTGWEWPYVAVHGAQPGPAVLVIAGIHGSEYVSIDAVVRLGALLDPATLRGQVLCLPLLNPAAYWERKAFVSPVDNLNPNRAFPGRPQGSFTERMAYHLTERAIRHADAFMDLHGGDIPEALVPFCIYEETGDAAVDDRSREMADAFGLPAVLVQAASNSPIGGTTYSTASRLGVPAIIAEDGGAGVFDQAASDRMLLGAENTLRVLGALPGTPLETAPPVRYRRFAWVYTQHAGFFRSAIQVGDEVRAGESLGTVGDFFGNTLQEVTSDTPGRVLFLTVSAAVAAPGLICGIGVE